MSITKRSEVPVAIKQQEQIIVVCNAENRYGAFSLYFHSYSLMAYYFRLSKDNDYRERLVYISIPTEFPGQLVVGVFPVSHVPLFPVQHSEFIPPFLTTKELDETNAITRAYEKIMKQHKIK